MKGPTKMKRMKELPTLTAVVVSLVRSVCMVSIGFAKEHGFTTIDVPGGSATATTGINPEGNIVGIYFNNATDHGFLLSKGVFTTIDFPGASQTDPFGISPDGKIVGFYRNATGNHGFLLSKGAFTTIDAPGASET